MGISNQKICRFLRRVSCVSVMIALALLYANALADESPAPVIPVNQGATWVYNGSAKWWGVLKANEHGVKSGRIRAWKMSVVKTARRGDVSAALISGFPDDLAWYGSDADAPVPPRPGVTLVVQNAEGLFVEPLEDQAKVDLRMGEALDHKLKLEMDEYQMLRFPVRVGDCLSTETIALKYNMWCWYVAGSVKTKFGSGWRIEYRTNPDQQSVDIVPGVGIVRYTYHHGPLAGTDVYLTSFRP